MTLVRRKHNRLFPSIFEDFFNDSHFDNMIAGSTHMQPSVNVKENDDDFQIELAVPGMSKEDFKVEVDHGVLHVGAAQSEEKGDKDDNGKYTRREFNYSSFRRSFRLPTSVDSTQIGAKYEDGVLILSLPKKEEAKVQAPKSIEIQ